MNRDDVIRMARESGLLIPSFRIDGGLALGACTVPDLERFAALVAATEREAYAKETKKLFVQLAPSVPEGWQLVPTAESRHPGIYKMLGALHAADNTPGMSEWESYRAMLAAAPKPEE